MHNHYTNTLHRTYQHVNQFLLCEDKKTIKNLMLHAMYVETTIEFEIKKKW